VTDAPTERLAEDPRVRAEWERIAKEHAERPMGLWEAVKRLGAVVAEVGAEKGEDG